MRDEKFNVVVEELDNDDDELIRLELNDTGKQI